MFACIYGPLSPKLENKSSEEALLIELAFTFSPLVEQTSRDTVVLDVSGQGVLFGAFSQIEEKPEEVEWIANLAAEIIRRAQQIGLNVNVSVAANPDAAIHSARCFTGITIIPEGEELSKLGSLLIKRLDHSLLQIEPKRVAEIAETLTLWGIKTFADLARLPLAGVAQRLGQEGVQLQRLAQGKSKRHLTLVQPPIGFEQTLELEHPVSELEPLSFILSRLLNQLCANLYAYALAANELRLRVKLENKTDYQRTITLPVPMGNPKVLLRLLLLDIENQPPTAPIISMTIAAEPVKPRVSQTGLFLPLAPEPEKLEVTLARLAKLVGADKVGSPEMLNTHRPDVFRLKRFTLAGWRRKSNPKAAITNSRSLIGFRMFRPPCPVQVQIRNGRPGHITTGGVGSMISMRGNIICASGPWRGSGDWWRNDLWARDEWDVAVANSKGEQSEVLCRIYRDLRRDEWFIEGVYD